ncbi:uncharacterized protein LY79DRAFT_569425 [Colletotrichum navitas]|uniref:Uncharacterized protein n=1 Tax=Colletotrichum navitas TaxID=681940 RepID=A0AAD8PMK4_9PEZI|nr:uncharacterized protein LY79DRAFT_569425 [Colletotrichum navitas]KAK1572867.1 hypothetical protein LY79DRAFT_569425 [Colletotrichum navitas]
MGGSLASQVPRSPFFASWIWIALDAVYVDRAECCFIFQGDMSSNAKLVMRRVARQGERFGSTVNPSRWAHLLRALGIASDSRRAARTLVGRSWSYLSSALCGPVIARGGNIEVCERKHTANWPSASKL